MAITSATRPAAMVFGVHLSARSRLTGIDPEDSGLANERSFLCYWLL